MPTTPFVLLAAWCFVKSSKRAHQWLYRQPVLGQALTQWEKHRSISRPAKIAAVSSISISGILMWIKVTNIFIKISVVVLLLGIAIFIIKQKDQ